MKNVRLEDLKKCIFMLYDEFAALICALTDGMAEIGYDEGIYITSSFKAKGTGYEPSNAEIMRNLSDYFAVNVTSFHSDDCDLRGVWICYKEESDTTFMYGSYHFTPAGKMPTNYDIRTATKYLMSDFELGIGDYRQAKYKYSHADFYKMSGNSEADIFLCLENGLYYMPGEHELFRYNGEVI